MESFEELTKTKESSANTSGVKTPENVSDLETPQGARIPGIQTDTTGGSDPIPTAIGDNSQVHRAGLIAPALYPHLTHTTIESSKSDGDETTYDDDEEPRLATSFERISSPVPALQRDRVSIAANAGDEGFSRMHKFTLYETTNYFYIIGIDLLETSFRIMKIDRTSEPGELNVSEDEVVYTKRETSQILNAIDEGNQSTGGLKVKVAFWGLLGFIRFTGPYYMIVVTKRSPVAMIGGHYIYRIDSTELVPITPHNYGRTRPDRNPEETRFLHILKSLDLSRSFYFSYSYDVTRTLQFNIMREREALHQDFAKLKTHDRNDMFVWNHYLLTAAKGVFRNPDDWCLSIIHGYVDQAALSVYWGRVVYLTIIARRSRFFAGARFLKRGANDLGYVANDVETEQIVSEMLTTSFHAPGPVLFANQSYTSYVQHRGSIPLYWTQDSSGVQPKPDIHLNVVDPFFSAAALHFDNLFQRYGTPIYVLNLVKSRERTPRESKLLKEYTTAINYLNQFLPQDKKILHHAWDMSRASKSGDQDVIGSLEAIADDILPKTGFFQNGRDISSGLRLQNGVARTNCIDCLDRTNAAQFVIAKKALGYQLQALGVIEYPSVEYDSDAVNLFTNMWHDHGDSIAVQYGGSHLVNTMSTYRKINQWTSHSRDMVETFKRFYNNSFMDAQRQEAYNLFLGNYIFAEGQPMLWDLSTDYYLHHMNPRSMFGKHRPSYCQWYTPSYLEPPSIYPALIPREFSKRQLKFFDDYWIEYYRPLALSSLKKIFSFKMQSNLAYIPIRSTQDGKYDLSPFRVRSNQDAEASSQKKLQTNPHSKGVKIIAPSDTDTATSDVASSISSRATLVSPTAEQTLTPKISSLGPWLDAQQQLHGHTRRYTGIIKEASFEDNPQVRPLPTMAPNNHLPPTKADLALEAFTRLVADKLQPSVPEAELREYEKYIAHPSKIPLVVTSSEVDYSKAPLEFLEYLGKVDDRYFSYLHRTTVPEDMGLITANDSATSLAAVAGAAVPTPVARTRTSSSGGLTGVAVTVDERAQANADEYAEFLEISSRPEGLTVLEEDGEKKRYKRYRQWLRGKSLFKQRPVVGGEAV